MNAIVDIIVPVFGTVAVGWLIGRTGLLSPEGLRGLTNVTFYSLFPALLFRSMSQVRVQALSLDILVVFFGTALLLYFPLMLLGRAMGMRLGDRTVMFTTRNRPRFWAWLKPGKQGEADHPHRRPLMLDQEVARMAAGQQLIIRPGMKPMLTDRICWWNDPLFAKRQRSPPVVDQLRIEIALA